MWAITLCSVWPTSSGRTRNAASTATVRSDDLEHRHRGPHSGRRDPGRLDPAAAGRLRRVVAFARLLGPRPRLRRAGGEDERLAQRRPLEALRQQQRPQAQAGPVVEPLDVDPEHLVRLPLVPGGSGEKSGEARQGGAVRVCGCAAGAHAGRPGWRCRARCSTTSNAGVRAGRLVVGLVHGGQPVEEGEALGHQLAGRAAPLRRADVEAGLVTGRLVQPGRAHGSGLGHSSSSPSSKMSSASVCPGGDARPGAGLALPSGAPLRRRGFGPAAGGVGGVSGRPGAAGGGTTAGITVVSGPDGGADEVCSAGASG